MLKSLHLQYVHAKEQMNADDSVELLYTLVLSGSMTSMKNIWSK